MLLLSVRETCIPWRGTRETKGLTFTVTLKLLFRFKMWFLYIFHDFPGNLKPLV